MRRRKIRKSVWVTASLAIYGAAMSAYFGPQLIAEGRALKFWLSVAVEVIFIVGLFFALRRKESLHDSWPNQDGPKQDDTKQD